MVHSFCGWQVKLCKHMPFLSALEVVYEDALYVYFTFSKMNQRRGTSR